VPEKNITVVPFGINDPPTTGLSPADAKARLGLRADEHVALFFGQIAPYKGLAYLARAVPRLIAHDPAFRLVVAGKVKKGHEAYWSAVKQALQAPACAGRVILKIEHVPDQDLELYFKAADVLVMPYTDIFQSGVLFLAYSFGLPVVAADVGSLRDDVIEGRTGLMCKPHDARDLERAINAYFAGAIYRALDTRRQQIRAFASATHSWMAVAAVTAARYRSVLASH
jgi:glycosyltransferase involved in cell wall biosynthesis